MDEGIRCQVCGADNPSDSVFRQRCGGKIGRAEIGAARAMFCL